MKTFLISIAFCQFLAVSYTTTAIVQFELNNRLAVYGIDAPVVDSQGVALEGTNYLAELWGGPDSSALAPGRSLNGNDRVFATFHSPGYFRSPKIILVFETPGTLHAWLQVRVWDVRLGATYEDAAKRGLGGYGESALFYAEGSPILVNPAPPKPLKGLEAFDLLPVTGVLVRAIRPEGDTIVIEWIGVFGHYQVQDVSALNQTWTDAGERTLATSSTNAIVGAARFFRVIGLPPDG